MFHPVFLLLQAYVTCAIGVHMVGYAMLCMSACGALSSVINGRIQKHIGTMPLMVIGEFTANRLLLYLQYYYDNQIQTYKGKGKGL